MKRYLEQTSLPGLWLVGLVLIAAVILAFYDGGPLAHVHDVIESIQ